MTVYDIAESIRLAEARLGVDLEPKTRRPRSDRGRSRLPSLVAVRLTELLSEQERPKVRELLRELAAFCSERGLSSPSRATVYNFMARAQTPRLKWVSLPPAVRAALYNLEGVEEVPAHQVAFYCFNYGETTAMSFAAGLPWLALYQAERMRGWRPRSRGLLIAARRARAA